MNCKHCNLPLDDDALSCPNCGTPVERPAVWSFAEDAATPVGAKLVDEPSPVSSPVFEPPVEVLEIEKPLVEEPVFIEEQVMIEEPAIVEKPPVIENPAAVEEQVLEPVASTQPPEVNATFTPAIEINPPAEEIKPAAEVEPLLKAQPCVPKYAEPVPPQRRSKPSTPWYENAQNERNSEVKVEEVSNDSVSQFVQAPVSPRAPQQFAPQQPRPQPQYAPINQPAGRQDPQQPVNPPQYAQAQPQRAQSQQQQFAQPSQNAPQQPPARQNQPPMQSQSPQYAPGQPQPRPQPQYAPMQPQPYGPNGGPNYGQMYAPFSMIKLKTNRSFIKTLLLSLITLGIYAIVVYGHITDDVNMVCSRYDGKKSMNYYLLWFLVGPVTLEIASIVWTHKICDRIGNELRRRGVDYNFGAKDFWLWGVLGTFILVGPFIFTHKFFKSVNLMNADFNEKGM